MFRHGGRIVHEAIWAPLIVGGVVFAVFFPSAVPRIPCGLKYLTDLPCMACGSTRAVMLLAASDPLGALRMNPLTTVLAIVAAFYVLHSAAVLIGWREPWRLDPKSSGFRWVRNVAVITIAINWAYLVIDGR